MGEFIFAIAFDAIAAITIGSTGSLAGIVGPHGLLHHELPHDGALFKLRIVVPIASQERLGAVQAREVGRFEVDVGESIRSRDFCLCYGFVLAASHHGDHKLLIREVELPDRSFHGLERLQEVDGGRVVGQRAVEGRRHVGTHAVRVEEVHDCFLQARAAFRIRFHAHHLREEVAELLATFRNFS